MELSNFWSRSISWCQVSLGKNRGKDWRTVYLHSIVDFICMRKSRFIDTPVSLIDLHKTKTSGTSVQLMIICLGCLCVFIPNLYGMKSLLGQLQWQNPVREAWKIWLVHKKTDLDRPDSVLGERDFLWLIGVWQIVISTWAVHVRDFGSACVPADPHAILSMSVPPRLLRHCCLLSLTPKIWSLKDYVFFHHGWLWSCHLMVGSVQGQPQDPQLGIGIERERASMSLSEWADSH